MAPAHTSLPFDITWLENSKLINEDDIKKEAQQLSSKTVEASREEIALKTIDYIDLTTLAGDDTDAVVEKLCSRAYSPLKNGSVSTAAVCVYPNRVKAAKNMLSKLDPLKKVQIASVAAGFPSGQYPLATRLGEIRYAIDQGATEIDIVIDRSLVLTDAWEQLYIEIEAMRKECGEQVHLKTILSVGELKTFQNIYKASMVAMMAGSDFIKTSTGKESVNATFPTGLVMMKAILDFKARTGRKIGFKPAGGIRTLSDATHWFSLVSNTLGQEWLTPNLFRFGASGLLDDVLSVVGE